MANPEAERPARRLLIALLAIGLSCGVALCAFGIVLIVHGRLRPGIIAELAAGCWLVPLLVLGVMAHRRAHRAGAKMVRSESR